MKPAQVQCLTLTGPCLPSGRSTHSQDFGEAWILLWIPVELYLAENNLTIFEKTAINARGEKISIVFSRSREMQQSTLSIGVDKSGDPRLSSREQQAFSSENATPFKSFQPKLKQTGIFVDRFFNNFTYADLAKKYDMTEKNAKGTFHNSINRILAVIEAMDNGEAVTKQVAFYKNRVKARTGNLPKGQKWYLLNKLFGLRPSEISELEDIDKKRSSVRQLIIRTSDQLQAGELSLIEVTQEEREAAKARLDTHRKKRRGRHARKKHFQ
jgi:hypothetical protein